MADKKLNLRFSKHFLWGASVSAHQVEGNNHNQWSAWESDTARVRAAQASYQYGKTPTWQEIKQTAQTAENYISGEAADHFNRYEHDFALASRLHFSALRVGIEWSRIEPEEGSFDREAVAHYKRYFMSLKKQNIEPIVTLWHWTIPVWFADKGGFAKRRNLKYFSRYAKYIAEQLGASFRYVITINEPTVYAVMSYHEERWPPEDKSKIRTVYVLYNLVIAHRRSYKIIKKVRPRTKVGLAHNCSYNYPGDSSWISRLSAWKANKLQNEFFINRARRHQDFFGLNYYFANRYCGTRVHNQNTKESDLGWDLQPEKLNPLLSSLYNRYKTPIMITENGLADKNDTHRQWWLAETIKAMDSSLKDGVSLLGYLHWSLLDNFEWAEGYWPRFGLIEVNYKTQQRKPRPSALWYSKVIKTLQETDKH